MKVNLATAGLAVVVLTASSSFTSCNARPQHVRGHRHGDHGHRIDQSLASSGSNVDGNTGGNSTSVDVPVDPNPCVAMKSCLESADISLTPIVPLVIQNAAPIAAVLEEFDVSRAVNSIDKNLKATAAVNEPDATSTKTGHQCPAALGNCTDAGHTLHNGASGRSHGLATADNELGASQTRTRDVVSTSSIRARLLQRATSTSTSTSTSATGNPGDGGYQSFVLSFPSAISTSVAATATLCPADNGTGYTSDAKIDYTVVCGTDYKDGIQPFYLTGSFVGCVQKCDAYNYDHGGVKCIAAIFVPSRTLDQDDCYLKSSINHPVASNGKIEGAVRKGFASSSTSTSLSSQTATSSATSSSSQTSSRSSSVTNTSSSSSSTASNVGIVYATGSAVIAPAVASSHLQGPSQNQPSTQYINMQSGTTITLASSLLVPGVNGDLSTGYDLSSETGVLQVNISTQSMLSPLKGTPHLSRDGGRGGYVNGQHLFIFCDTGSYTAPLSGSNGNFLAFVSSSAAVDVGMNGLSGKALHLQDGIGEWSDDVGRMRGFAPLTEGEFAYNQAMQGNGQRYAIWPESALIPLDAETSLMYAPIVYDNVNMATKAAVFTYTGNTLLTVTAGGQGGPVAQRAVDKLFDQDEIEFGCSGGIRSWGPSGVGGADGKVYVFGITSGGVLLGRTSPGSVADRSSYQYWGGSSWSSAMPSTDSKAFFLTGPYMDVDVFYSPRHLTFIVVYLTIYADSTFYYRYLKAPSPILPGYAPGGDANSDYVENLTKYPWSDQQVLYKASPGKNGKYIYSGGVQSRYYGTDDIYNGGSKMLISWTAPTGEDPSSLDSEYQLVTAEIDWT